MASTPAALIPSFVRARFPARVLIVDDEPLVRWALAAGLRLAGFQATCAATAREAIAAALGRPAPDVILLDRCLMGSRTCALAAALRRVAPAARIVTLAAGIESAAAGRTTATIAKPFDLNAVIDLVNEIAGAGA